MAQNDYSNWKPLSKPQLGEVIRLHQADEEAQNCIYCNKSMNEWGSMEKCLAWYN